MVSLGKVAAPKPINLPSQKKENNGNDPTVNLISKGSGWGTASGGYGGGDDASASKQHAPERAIPAQPTPAWGGAGLPEERKKQVEMASQQEFPVLGTERGQGHEGGHGRMGHPYGDDPHRRPWDADERSYAGPPEDGPYRGRYYDRERFDRFDRPLPYDRHFERGPPRYDGPPGPYERERYERHGPPPGDRDRYAPPRHYPPPEFEEGYGPPRRAYYDGPPDEREYGYRFGLLLSRPRPPELHKRRCCSLARAQRKTQTRSTATQKVDSSSRTRPALKTDRSRVGPPPGLYLRRQATR